MRSRSLDNSAEEFNDYRGSYRRINRKQSNPSPGIDLRLRQTSEHKLEVKINPEASKKC